MAPAVAASPQDIAPERTRPFVTEVPTDGQLLEGFARRREADAFAALMRRHGPMVLSVCRRVLHHAHDAEDAFQATFLVLARSAASIGKSESVGSWLYRVAYRLSGKVKARAARKYLPEQMAPGQETPEPLMQAAWRELRAVLDEELNRLPEKYRAPLILCYLEGNTHEETAQQLGWPLGTVRSRLARARDVLRGRLVRRGLAVSATAFATLVAAHAAPAAPTATLADATLRAAAQFVAPSGGAVTGVSAQVLALAHAGLRVGSWAWLKTGVAMLVALALLAVGGMPGREEPSPVSVPAEPIQSVPAVPTVPPPGTQPSEPPAPAVPLVRTAPVRIPVGAKVRSVALSPDGQVIATGSTDAALRMYNTVDGHELHAVTSLAATPNYLYFAGNGQTLVEANDLTIRFREARTAREMVKLPVATNALLSLAVSPNGEAVAASGKDNKIRMWLAATGQEKCEFSGHQGVVSYLTFAPDGKTLASVGGDNTVRLWDVGTGKEMHCFQNRQGIVRTVNFAANGKAVAAGADRDLVVFWDVAAGKTIHEYETIWMDLTTVTLSPDARNFALAGRDHRVHLREVATGKELRTLNGSRGPVFTLTFSANAQKLAAADATSNVFIWDLNEVVPALPMPGK